MIDQQIAMGIFDRDTLFPHSPKRKESYFNHYIKIWQDNEQGTVAPSSWKTYLSKVQNHITPYWGKKQISKMSPEDFEKWVNKVLLPNLAPKTIKDIKNLWQTIWTYWARTQKNPNDPTQYIKLGSRDPDDINPFNKDEIRQIIEAETNHTLKNLWTVMLWSGLSSHELLALAVSDLKIKEKQAHIQRGVVKHTYRVTKTRRRNRQIELLPIVAEALTDQCCTIIDTNSRTISVLDRDHNTEHKQTLQFLWHNPNTGSHYTYPQLEKRWKRHLKLCDIPYRPLNNGRHTYASQVLSTGSVTAEWLANQLGHTSTDMIHRHYGKFIPKDSKHIIDNLVKALE